MRAGAGSALPLLALAGAALLLARAAPLYSSFYAPLADPRLLGYRVDIRFDEAAGKRARAAYEARAGPRGRDLVRALGAGGAPPGPAAAGNELYGDVRVRYTYPGAYTYPGSYNYQR